MDTFVHFWARCLPNRGKVLSQQGQAACPTWARIVIIFFTFCCPCQGLWFGYLTRKKTNRNRVFMQVLPDSNSIFLSHVLKRVRHRLMTHPPQSFMRNCYLTSIFLVAFVSSLGVSFGIWTSRTPSATFHTWCCVCIKEYIIKDVTQPIWIIISTC